MMASQIIGSIIRTASALLAVVGTAGAAQPGASPAHVFIIVLENERVNVSFGAKSPAKYLKSLAQQGALLPNYYGIGHNSLDNYIAMVSGQAPNPITQADCWIYTDFVATGTDKYGQAIGQGCVYPESVRTVANQLEEAGKGLTWKGYMEDMGNHPDRESAACAHPQIGQADGTQKAVLGDQYASRHDPFVYFHSIIDHPTCAAHVVNLASLENDLKDEATTPNLAFITPNLCHDGHDDPCKSDEPAGLVAADKFLADRVPAILASPAYRHDGLLIITFDEADTKDTRVCCHDGRAPNIGPGAQLVFSKPPPVPDRGPGISGKGGGQVGAVLVSPFIRAGTVSKTPYNHYALLRSIEDFFGLDHLGYAGTKSLRSFGKDVFTAVSLPTQ
jgi:hypothetical protein